MGNPHLQYVNINDCVTAYMDESEQGVHKQFKLTQLAFRAMDELGLDFFYRIKSVLKKCYRKDDSKSWSLS